MSTRTAPASTSALHGRPWGVVRDRASSGSVYLDASALVKLFITEPESRSLNRALRGQRQVMVSDLTVTETISAFARRAREGALPWSAVERVHSSVLGYVESGAVQHVGLSPRVHRRAERLLLAYTAGPLRAMDALHLALAVDIGVEAIITFDRRLGSAAAHVGVPPLP